MINVDVVLKNESGLHARPASQFVQEASKYKSDITIVKDQNRYNAKSIITILSMGAGKGDRLMIEASGEDEKKAVEALQALVDNCFDEGVAL